MTVNVAREVALLRKRSTAELRDRYAEVFGETTNANNKIWLIKRIVWRLQAVAEGGLTERARRRAEELADDSLLRLNPSRERMPQAAVESTCTGRIHVGGEERVPPPGSIITREYKGETVQVKVLADGFEYAGERFKSLSAAARAITGQHLNGFAFFNLGKAVAR